MLLPYGLVCALFGTKNLLDPWFTDEVWKSGKKLHGAKYCLFAISELALKSILYHSYC